MVWPMTGHQPASAHAALQLPVQFVIEKKNAVLMLPNVFVAGTKNNPKPKNDALAAQPLSVLQPPPCACARPPPSPPPPPLMHMCAEGMQHAACRRLRFSVRIRAAAALGHLLLGRAIVECTCNRRRLMTSGRGAGAGDIY